MATLADTMKGLGKIRNPWSFSLVATVMIGFFSSAVLALRISAAPMAPLYTGLTLDDSAKIVAELEKTGTPYEIVRQRFRSIMVPSDRVLRLRHGYGAARHCHRAAPSSAMKYSTARKASAAPALS